MAQEQRDSSTLELQELSHTKYDHNIANGSSNNHYGDNHYYGSSSRNNEERPAFSFRAFIQNKWTVSVISVMVILLICVAVLPPVLNHVLSQKREESTQSESPYVQYVCQ